MTLVKPFGILVEGQGGGGGRAKRAPIADIAGIARDRRDRKGKISPLINTDDTDRKKAKNAEVHANLYPSTRTSRVDGARLGWLGMTLVKPFGILVEGQGGGGGAAERAYPMAYGPLRIE